MRTKLLTEFQQTKMFEYLKGNMHKTDQIRNIARRARKVQVKRIREDLLLIERFLAAYGKGK